VAVLRSGQTMYGVAASLGVSYNHLILVLDGKRKGSAKLEAGILRALTPVPFVDVGRSPDAIG